MESGFFHTNHLKIVFGFFKVLLEFTTHSSQISNLLKEKGGPNACLALILLFLGYEIYSYTIPDLCIVQPNVFGDEQGAIFESFNKSHFTNAGIDAEFIQDNESLSGRGVVRGLHFQTPPYRPKETRKGTKRSCS